MWKSENDFHSTNFPLLYFFSFALSLTQASERQLGKRLRKRRNRCKLNRR